MTKAALALVAALVLAACGGDGGEPAAVQTTAPPPTTAPALTSDPAVIGEALKNAATAEESYAIDAGKYTASVADLREQGLPDDPRVRVAVVSASKDAYCLSAAGAGDLVAYYDSKTGRTSRTPCA